jgi:xylose dehydrogenase (NAD/NADP)
MRKVRWGLLSTARINRRLIPAIRASRRGQLMAVASRDAAHAKAYAAEWEIPHNFGSYQAMLDSGEIEAVYIGLPNHLHAEWSIRALEAGVNVLCEKPFAITMEQVDAMIKASHSSGKALAEAFMYRHHPQTKIVKEWVQEGRLGEIVLLRGTFSFKLDDPGNVRLVPEWGGGSLWDVGVYPVSFAQYILGSMPERVSAAQTLGPSGVDEVFTGQMVYKNSVLAQISSSFRSPWYAYAEVLGSAGRLVLNRPFAGMDDGKKHLFFHDKDDRSHAIYVPRQELYLGEINDMHDAILEGKPNYLTLDETRNHVRTALALYEAARTQTEVFL